MPSRTPRPFTVEHFRRWCLTLTLDNDKPWKLEEFQARFVRDLFAGRTVNWLVIPEGNAKTTLVAGICLYKALHRPNRRIVVAAAAKDQAFWLYDSMRGLVVRSELGPQTERVAHESRIDEPDTFRCLDGFREVRVNGSLIKVYAADDRTGDGAIFDDAILEELHRHKDLRLYRTWRGKAFKKGGQVIAISTAGDPEGEFEKVRKAMKENGKITVRGAFTRVVSATTVIHDYTLPEGKSPDNMRHVKTCNPLRAITTETLREKYEDPSIQAAPFHWLRFVCDRPASLDGESVPITDEQWDPLRVDIGAVTDGEPVWVAVRVGQQGGCSIGIAAIRGDGVAVRAEVYPYNFPGLERALQRLVTRYDVRMIYVDKRQHGIGTDVLEAAGLPLEDEPQTPVRLMEASATFLGMLSAGTLVHDGDEVLRKQALMSRMKETVTGAYFEPSAETQALIAVVMASHQASKHANDRPPKIHAYRGGAA